MNKNRIKLLIRGGSISAGFGVTRSYVDIIADRFNHIEVINRSRVKENTFHGVWTFNDDIDIFKPDILILHFGIDDAYNPVYRSEFKENLVQIVRLARKRFSPKIILLTSHPFENQYDMEMIYIYYRVIREVAVDLECEFVPVHVCWASVLDERGMNASEILQNDCRYPNERGHEVYAEVVTNKLLDILS